MMPDGSGTGLENRGQQKGCGGRHLRPAPIKHAAISYSVRNLPAKEAVLHGPWAFESLSQRQYAQVAELEYAPG